MRSVAGELEESFLQRRGVRTFFQAGGRVAGQKLAGVEDSDTVSEELDFLERVGREEQSGIAGFQDPLLKKIAKLGGGNGIEAAGRLIEKQHGRTMKQRAGEAQALHGTGGKRAHLAIESIRQLESRGELSDACGCRGGRHSIEAAEKKEVLASAEARVKAEIAAGVKSEIAAHSGGIARDVVTRDPREAIRRQEESSQDTEQRGFAGAVCAKQSHGFAGRGFQRDAGERRDRGFLKGLEQCAPAAARGRKGFLEGVDENGRLGHGEVITCPRARDNCGRDICGNAGQTRIPPLE